MVSESVATGSRIDDGSFTRKYRVSPGMGDPRGGHKDRLSVSEINSLPWAINAAHACDCVLVMTQTPPTAVLGQMQHFPNKNS